MSTREHTAGPRVQVVVNHEEQYSIWPADREPPAGWTPVGVAGPEEECLDWIEAHWTDLRPLSLRRAMGAERVAAP
ncbi:putative MbtH-like protein [Actinokineospora spheciospongiae]|uniref:Putative MbtH-like protein n=1 Tax=Actinokineospora spheciospongiae TaxID=909613 RepID=W7IRY5_9PSEU|nr:MbtH family NRPS accessory protein [Actinokineospora spheciospongiae]EWC63680.1 putative MbtH-like protein [Actinokineospora spheciospongiae]PWW66622.1 MbtH protein [Actinokineospora spheciospongiae]